MPTINFGTSGWRAGIADGFTAANVKKVAQAISLHILHNKEYGFNGSEYQNHCKNKKITKRTPVVVIGYDTRYMAENFASVAADAFADNAISVKIAAAPCPTPVVGWNVLHYGAVGGIMLTGGEDKFNQSGIKWIPFWGGPATNEIMQDIERYISGSPVNMPPETFHNMQVQGHLVEKVDMRQSYFNHLSTLIDGKKIKSAGLKIGVDSFFGAAAAYLRPYLDALAVKTIGFREERDVFFGNRSMRVGPESLKELSEIVRKNKLDMGFACDIDGDGFAVLDERGEWVSPNDIMPLIFEHIWVNKGMRGKVCRSVVTSHFVDAVAKKLGAQVRETSVGFNHIGELIHTGQYILGGEEAGGLSIAGHVPNKDGIITCLLTAEAVAFKKKTLSAALKDMRAKYGHFYSSKVSISLETAKMERLVEKLSVNPPLNIGGFAVWRIDQTDGFKFIFRDGSWMGIRPSGVQPIVRLYAETIDEKKLSRLLTEGEKLIRGK